jgi:hypothetical protein
MLIIRNVEYISMTAMYGFQEVMCNMEISGDHSASAELYGQTTSFFNLFFP